MLPSKYKSNVLEIERLLKNFIIFKWFIKVQHKKNEKIKNKKK